MRCYICQAECRKQYEIQSENNTIDILPTCEVHAPNRIEKLVLYQENRKEKYLKDTEYRNEVLEKSKERYSQNHGYTTNICRYCNAKCYKYQKDGSPTCSKCTKIYGIKTYKKGDL